jgi:Flp pilus assembly pilin Flp
MAPPVRLGTLTDVDLDLRLSPGLRGRLAQPMAIRSSEANIRAMNRWHFKLAFDGRCRDAGQGLVEYGLILTLVAIVAILSLAFIGGDLQGMLSKVGTSV